MNKQMKNLLSIPFIMLLCISCNSAQNTSQKMQTAVSTESSPSGQTEIATLGGGCFWCVEAVYQELKGVLKVESGYTGGRITDPTYKEVCSGMTGHAEVVQVTFDPVQVSYADVLRVFFSVHDPTTLNRQGNDVGTQYRSVIYYHSEQQRDMAETIKKEAAEAWDNPVVTEISAAEKFYKAEDYHQNYYRENPNQGYCSFIITPKLKKFREKFADKLKQ